MSKDTRIEPLILHSLTKIKIIVPIFLIAFAMSIGLYFINKHQKKNVLTPLGQTTTKPLYKGVTLNTKVSIFAENINQITDLEITPDGNYMLAATLPGKIYAFQKIDGQWYKQNKEFFSLDTFQPGFPPEEAGLTGMIIDANFGETGEVFLTYALSPEKKIYINRVTKVEFTKIGGEVLGLNPSNIYQSNTLGSSSHQIQDGISLLINGESHILFGVGDGFDAKLALQLDKEAGKLILLKTDGSKPEGERPYDNPLLQVSGVRNPPDIAYNKVTNKIMVSDTGPDNNDRLIYGRLVDTTGNNVKRLTFNWDGTESSLIKSIPNPYESGNMLLYKWAPTKTPVALNFYTNPKLPKLTDGQSYVLVTLFGKTGWESNKPGKEILLGTLTEEGQDRISFKTLVERDKDGEGKLAHPIGTVVDPTTSDIYFADLMEGRIYKVVIGGDK